MQREERRTEASREGRRRLGDTALGTGQLGGEAREEVVFGLFRRQDRNRGQHAEGVGRKEDHLLGSRGLRYGLHDIVDVEDRVRYAGVLRHGLVREVDLTFLVHRNVLQQGVGADRVPDIGLVLFREVDDFGIASALEVEDAVVVPTVLVVADQLALRVGRKGGFARSRQTEEDGGVLALLVGVGRAVHRRDALERKQVVHVGEHTLLHFAAVPGVDDYLHFFGEVEHDRRFRVESEFLVVLDFGFRGVQHHEIGFAVLLQLLVRRADEHVFHEMRLPGDLHDEADLQTGVLVGSAERVHDEELLVRQLFDSDLFQLLPGLLRHRFVVVLVFGRGPPDGIFGGFVHDEELVFRGTTRVNAGHHVHGTHFGYLTLFITAQALAGLLAVEFVVRRVVDYFRSTRDAVLFQIDFSHNY